MELSQTELTEPRTANPYLTQPSFVHAIRRWRSDAYRVADTGIRIKRRPSSGYIVGVYVCMYVRLQLENG
jgi:hypothetical protein